MVNLKRVGDDDELLPAQKPAGHWWNQWREAIDGWESLWKSALVMTAQTRLDRLEAFMPAFLAMTQHLGVNDERFEINMPMDQENATDDELRADLRPVLLGVIADIWNGIQALGIAVRDGRAGVEAWAEIRVQVTAVNKFVWMMAAIDRLICGGALPQRSSPNIG